MNTPLFRPEALAQRHQVWLGTIRLSQPVGLRWLTAGVLVIVLALLAFLFWGQASRTQRLSGVLVPDRGLIQLLPGAPGTVLHAQVKEGQRVRTGESLFILQQDGTRLTPDAQTSLRHTFDSRERSLDEAVAQAHSLQAQRGKALKTRLDAARRELIALDAQVHWQRQRLALAEQAVARLESLRDQQFISPAQLQTRQEDMMGLRADLVALARQRQNLLREISTLAAEAQELPLHTAQRVGELERARAEVAETAARADEQNAQRELPVRSPADAVVTAVHVAPGQAVAADLPLATLIPADARLQAQLYAPSRALGLIQSGQPVLLRVQAFPYQKFGLRRGQVLHIAQAPVRPTDLAGLPLAGLNQAGTEPLYRVTVALDEQTVPVNGQARPLLAGMQLEADVVLERRRLIEWLIEPLQGWLRSLA